MSFRFSKRSRENMRDVHPDLVTVVVTCLYRYTNIDFVVIEGKRTEGRQRKLVDAGKSWTMNSYHRIQRDGWAHAVDIVPLIKGDVPWNDPVPFRKIADAMLSAAEDLDIKITWGGEWDQKDLPHFQLEV